MKKSRLIPISLLVLFSLSAHAYESSLDLQTQNGLTFVSGGVGEEEINEMRSIRSQYNLSLLFSVQGSGDYLSDLKVQISDAHGKSLVEALSEGPMFFVRMKPGRYSVVVEQAGRVLKKSTTIKNKGNVALSFTWPATKADLNESGMGE